MTYDAGTDSITTEDNLTPEEQESLQVGEAMQAEQEQLLAGKYKNAEDLDKAYVELQKKLGEGEEASSETEQPTDAKQEEETEDTDETKEEAPDYAFLDTLYEEATSGKEYNKETIEQLSKLSTEQVADMHLR